MQIPESGTGAVVVDLGALARNYRKLCAAAAPAECAAVVKANAYGLGVEPVVRRLLREGCRRFFVAQVGEGEQLRALSTDAAIYVLEGAAAGQSQRLVEAALIPVLSSLEQAERWAADAPVRRAALHVDTGISRLGLSALEVHELVNDRELLDRLELEYLVTHFACADEPEHALNGMQLERFDALRRLLPQCPVSIGNSAAIFLDAAHRGDLVRAGIALYGGNPFGGAANPMEPVVTLKARILQIREIDEAVTVGYGATYAAVPPARLATLGLGYADGFPRALGNVGAAAIAGHRVPIVGRVSMDLMCVDVSALPRDAVRCGDWAELIGPTISLEEVAAGAGTIHYEILTRLAPRLHRDYVE